jgi:hypothetical protein
VLRVATANVCTLDPAGARKWGNAPIHNGLAQHGRVAILERMFEEHHLAVVSLQEGRLSPSQVRHGVNYTMVIAGASPAGCYGSQIWIQRSLARFLGAHFVTSPRTLAVEIKYLPHSIWYISAHAPSAHAKTEELREFWHDLDSTYMKCVDQDHDARVIVLGDFNAHLGSVRSEAVGGCCPTKECRSGTRFRGFLESHSLRALNTFSGGGYSWTGTRGHQHRLDYVAASLRDAHAFTEIGPVETLDPGVDFVPWHKLITEYPAEWKALVARCTSALSSTTSTKAKFPGIATHICQHCDEAFTSPKGKEQHERIVHGQRSWWRQFVGKRPKCRSCGKTFPTRLRAIAHLSDPRRNLNCRAACIDGTVQPFGQSTIGKLDVEATGLRATARRAGHSQPLA